jgi:hypothetical protein
MAMHDPNLLHVSGTTARTHMDPARFAAIWAEGSALTLDQAADAALREG